MLSELLHTKKKKAIYNYNQFAVCTITTNLLGWRIHGSVEDTKLSINKQHTHSLFYLLYGPGWRKHGGVEDTKLSTNKHHSLSPTNLQYTNYNQFTEYKTF
jgi:hypothetical protein